MYNWFRAFSLMFLYGVQIWSKVRYLNFSIVCFLRTALNSLLRTSEGWVSLFNAMVPFVGSVHMWHHLWMVPCQENEMCDIFSI